MNASRLWAPWRINYIKNIKPRICIFCKARGKKSNDYVILRTKYSLAMLNIFPYNNGHTLVAPLRHVKKISQLQKREILDLWSTLNKVQALLDRVLKPEGYNIGMNISRVAGAGIPGHLHVHIVPRWKADTNFMPVLSDTKIISQSLDELYKELIKYA